MNQDSILQQADRIINGERQASYGPPSRNFVDIGRIWSVVLGIDVTPEQVALCMIGLKMARLKHTPEHRDSWLDIAGYVGCAEKLLDERA